jgi:hypothetical protein
MKDLVLLAADKNIQFTLAGALGRPQAMATRPITFDFRLHAGRDGGARSTGVDILATQRRQFARALLVFDREGCGRDDDDALTIERDLDARLERVWGNDAKAIVIEPEVDAWVWGADNAMRDVFGWPRSEPIRQWLTDQGFAFASNGKPVRPKEALEALRRVHQLPRSSALYRSIAEKISLQRCIDPAFVRLRDTLRALFPPVPLPASAS